MINPGSGPFFIIAVMLSPEYTQILGVSMVIIIRFPQPEITKMRGLATELVQKKESIEYTHIYYRIDIDYNISTIIY